MTFVPYAVLGAGVGLLIVAIMTFRAATNLLKAANAMFEQAEASFEHATQLHWSTVRRARDARALAEELRP